MSESGIALIHGEEFGSKQRRFITAGRRTNLQDSAAFIGLIARQQGEAKLMLQRGNAVLQFPQLRLGQFVHVRFGKHRLCLGTRLFGLTQSADACDDRLDLGQLPGGSHERVTREAFGKQRAQFVGASGNAVELDGKAHRSRSGSSARGTAVCAPLPRSFTWATPARRSSSPRMTAARAPMRLARSKRRLRLPR